MSSIVYLAGPMSDVSPEVMQGWRQTAGELLEGPMFTWRHRDPNRAPEFARPEPTGIKTLSPLRPYPGDSETAKSMNRRDFNDLKRSDVILACFLGADKVSLGTCLEMGAAWVLGIPVVTVMEEDNVHNNHPMLNDIEVAQFRTVEQACEFIHSFLGV